MEAHGGGPLGDEHGEHVVVLDEAPIDLREPSRRRGAELREPRSQSFDPRLLFLRVRRRRRMTEDVHVHRARRACAKRCDQPSPVLCGRRADRDPSKRSRAHYAFLGHRPPTARRDSASLSLGTTWNDKDSDGQRYDSSSARAPALSVRGCKRHERHRQSGSRRRWISFGSRASSSPSHVTFYARRRVSLARARRNAFDLRAAPSRAQGDRPSSRAIAPSPRVRPSRVRRSLRARCRRGEGLRSRRRRR